ncbi:protein kinase [Actinosynnema sp. NPDC020468]|uniref:protein kinase domain-containing protein n=1 Tax=Actinosynnema sp. NPDC020468 TaxID=3154488 RepID=UPI0033F6BD90
MWDGDLSGEVVDERYELGDLYGSGGMAEVYRALDTRLERKVAIKLFLGTATPEDQIRLAREAQMLAALRCPGVVTVYDTGSHRGRPFYVMQPIEGGTLRRRMREPLAPEVVARIGSQIAEILSHVHAHDVVHRDVKPSNILLEPGERRAYLADFGLALQAQVTRVTRSGILVGTAGYLAPEQVRGSDVTPASDVYALGLVLLECLTGRPEYPGGDTEAALARLHREPRIPADLPAPWAKVLTAMTATSPTKRPSAQACAHLLAEAERTSQGVRPLSTIRVADRPTPRTRTPTGRTLSVVAAMAAAITLLAVVFLKEPPEPALNRDAVGTIDTPKSTETPSTPSTAPAPEPQSPVTTLPPSIITVVEEVPAATPDPTTEAGTPDPTTAEPASPTVKTKKNGTTKTKKNPVDENQPDAEG